ncbi:MAG TPA: sigma-70 family RNA polymerase sigma factor [Acidimicrobiia bacterium]
MTHRSVQAVSRESTFEGFYEAQLDWARRLTFVLTGDDLFVDDLVQDAFVRLRPRFDQLDNPRAYLRVTLVNGVRRHRRRERRREQAHASLAHPSPEEDGALDDLVDRIDRLPYRQRAVLVLRYFENLSEAEIAESLGCRPGTVKSLASRALARLREET